MKKKPKLIFLIIICILLLVTTPFYTYICIGTMFYPPSHINIPILFIIAVPTLVAYLTNKIFTKENQGSIKRFVPTIIFAVITIVIPIIIALPILFY